MIYLGDAVVSKSKQKFVNDLSEVMVKKSGTYPWGEPRINPFDIQKVIYNNPATIVIWEDGTKTVVKCSENEEFDCEKGLAMCFAKKALGNKGNYYNTFHRYCDHNWKDILEKSTGYDEMYINLRANLMEEMIYEAWEDQERDLYNDICDEVYEEFMKPVEVILEIKKIKLWELFANVEDYMQWVKSMRCEADKRFEERRAH